VTERAFVLWKGHDGDAGIYSAEQVTDTLDFQDARKVSYFATSRGLAAVRQPRTFRILAAWRGAGEDSRVWTASADFNGAGWTDQRTPPDGRRTDDRPALGLLGERLFMAWRGTSPDEHIWWSELGSGGWTPQQHAGNGLASSTHGPALAEHAGQLVMAWKGSGRNQNLYWCTFDGASWTDPVAFPGGSTHGPALASSGSGQVVMAWTGSGSDERLWHATYAGNWSSQSLAIGRSSHGPALDWVGNGVVMVWKGAGGDEALWWSRDGFRTQHPMRDGYTTSESPILVPIAYGDL
jgi:hypothetical protein